MRCAEVTDPHELEAVFRLRFAVYVREMGRRYPHADAARERLEEPLDANAIHLAAWVDLPPGATPSQDEEIAGALRLHIGDPIAFAAVETLYGMPEGTLRGHCMVVKRLVTQPDFRGGPASAGLALARAAYRIALRESVDAAYIDCAASLAPFFEWMGFDVIRRFTHAEFGEIAVLRIDPTDRARLVRSGSPFVALLDRETARAAGAEGEVRATSLAS